MRLSSEAEGQRSAIERMCVSIESDAAIAGWLQVPVDLVAEVRASNAVRLAAERKAAEAAERESNARDCAQAAAVVSRFDMEGRSARLVEAQERMYRIFERRHGLNPGEGLVVNLYGWDALAEAKKRAA